MPGTSGIGDDDDGRKVLLRFPVGVNELTKETNKQKNTQKHIIRIDLGENDAILWVMSQQSIVVSWKLTKNSLKYLKVSVITRSKSLCDLFENNQKTR